MNRREALKAVALTAGAAAITAPAESSTLSHTLRRAVPLTLQDLVTQGQALLDAGTPGDTLVTEMVDGRPPGFGGVANDPKIVRKVTFLQVMGAVPLDSRLHLQVHTDQVDPNNTPVVVIA